MSSISVLTPSGDTTGATDTAAINSALSNVDTGGSVQLAPGDWYTNARLSVPAGRELAGVKGGMNGVTATRPAGSVIHPVTAFTPPGGVIDLADGVTGARVRNLAILNDLGSPADVDGIACHGRVIGTEIESVSIALVSGHGIAFYPRAGGANGDGLWMSRIMIQRPGKNGVHRPVNDASIHNVHVQYAGQVAGPGLGHGFYSTPDSGGNMIYVGCRADLCAGCGWLIDHMGTYGDATKLSCCSTERNAQDGVLVINSSGTGSQWRAPVIISGCCFEGDGHNRGTGGDFAGIRVRGKNRVFIDGTTVMVNTLDAAAGAPKYSLYLQQAGSRNAHPETVEWASGRMNYSTGQRGEAIHNYSLCDHLLIGTTVTQAGGYESTAISQRSGHVQLSAGAATVSTPWARGNSLIYLTNIGRAGTAGSLSVSARTAGSFTISSTSSSDASMVAWVIH